MQNKIIVMALCVPFLILFGWMMNVAFEVKTAPEVRVVIRGYDPRDLLSGHYIQYQIDWDKTDCSQFENGLCARVRFKWDGWHERFYIPESNAAELDDLFRRSNWRSESKDVFEVIYAFPKNGSPVAKRLLINGRDWREKIKN